MYTPAFATYVGGGWNAVKDSLKINKAVVYLYFAAPLITFLIFSFYTLMIYSIGAFTAIILRK